MEGSLNGIKMNGELFEGLPQDKKLDALFYNLEDQASKQKEMAEEIREIKASLAENKKRDRAWAAISGSISSALTTLTIWWTYFRTGKP